MSTKAFQKSISWQKGYSLTLLIYKVTRAFPKEEKYSLTSQIRRCAISIVSNISEGLLRNSKKELCRFLVIARGSCGELEAQLMLAKDLQYIGPDKSKMLIEKTTEIIKILNASIKTLQKY